MTTPGDTDHHYERSPELEELMAATDEHAPVEPAPPRTDDDPAKAKLLDLLAKPLVELTVGEAIYVALVLEGGEDDEDLLAELLGRLGLELPS